MTNTTALCLDADLALAFAADDALRPSAMTGWRTNVTATLPVTLPDGTTGTVRAVDVPAAIRGGGLVSPSHLYVAQGARLDLWHVAQLRLYR